MEVEGWETGPKLGLDRLPMRVPAGKLKATRQEV